MKKVLLALLIILPIISFGAEPELGKGYHYVMIASRFYALPPSMMANPVGANQVLTKSWATANAAGHSGALAIVALMGPAPPSSPSNADQVLTDVWNSANNALTVYCVSGCGGGGGTPGGSDTQVQFNDSGSFGGNASFTFDKSSGAGLVLGANSLLTDGSGGTMGFSGGDFGVSLASGGAGLFNSNGGGFVLSDAANANAISVVSDGSIAITPTNSKGTVFQNFITLGSSAFAGLGTPSNGTQVYCSDCDTPSVPGTSSLCTSSGDTAGAVALRIRGDWWCQ